MNEELINSILSGAAYEMALPRKVIIDKINNTDKKYPRGNGKERKNPL